MQLAYDGTHYHGWQKQDNSLSIQAIIEQGLEYKTGGTGGVTGCGRTDTGVHASVFYCHFDLGDRLNNQALADLTHNLNSYLPDDIVVHRIFQVNPEAHARFDAISRTYRYFIVKKKDPFNTRYAWLFKRPLKTETMNAACKTMIRHVDFTSFSKLHSNVKTNHCRIYHAEWTENENQLTFTVSADRFLRNMVRAMVGTLIRVGKEAITVSDFEKILVSKNRQNAGESVPAKGLFLSGIDYDWEKILPK